jgi:hypothetical protein
MLKCVPISQAVSSAPSACEAPVLRVWAHLGSTHKLLAMGRESALPFAGHLCSFGHGGRRQERDHIAVLGQERSGTP